MNEENKSTITEAVMQAVELEDEALDGVAGGALYGKDGRMVTTLGNKCEFFKHKKCGGSMVCEEVTYCSKCGNGFLNCNKCEYCTYERAIWWCNSPMRAKGSKS